MLPDTAQSFQVEPNTWFNECGSLPGKCTSHESIQIQSRELNNKISNFRENNRPIPVSCVI